MLMGKQTRDTCKAMRGFVRRGELTRQQGKTLIGHNASTATLMALERA